MGQGLALYIGPVAMMTARGKISPLDNGDNAYGTRSGLEVVTYGERLSPADDGGS